MAIVPIGHTAQKEIDMPTVIAAPAIIQAAGNKPKRIEEFIGRVNSHTSAVSIAKMTSPCGWIEPGQTPEFDVIYRSAQRNVVCGVTGQHRRRACGASGDCATR